MSKVAKTPNGVKTMTVIDRFMRTPDHQVMVVTTGDTPFRVPTTHPVGRHQVLSMARKALQDYRVFDLGPITGALAKAVASVPERSYWHNDDNSIFVIDSNGVDLPLAQPAAIGVYGTYLLDHPDLQAFIVVPFDMADERTGEWHAVLHLTYNPTTDRVIVHAGWAIGTGHLDADMDDAWVITANMMPIAAHAERAMSPEDRFAMWHDGGLIDRLTLVGNSLQHIILANDIATSAPVKHTTTPRKIQKANAKRGRPSTRGRSWIDLPGLRYEPATGTFRSVTPEGRVAWHQVRGFRRTLRSPRYGANQGTRIWVKPHSRGSKSVGVSNTPYRIPKQSA